MYHIHVYSKEWNCNVCADFYIRNHIRPPISGWVDNYPERPKWFNGTEYMLCNRITMTGNRYVPRYVLSMYHGMYSVCTMVCTQMYQYMYSVCTVVCTQYVLWHVLGMYYDMYLVCTMVHTQYALWHVLNTYHSMYSVCILTCIQHVLWYTLIMYYDMHSVCIMICTQCVAYRNEAKKKSTKLVRV